jgi:hypothetical protein
MVDLNSMFLYHNDLKKGPFYFSSIATYYLQHIIIYNHRVETHKVNCFYCKGYFIHLQSNILPTWAVFLNNVATQVKIHRHFQLYYETTMGINHDLTNFICQWFIRYLHDNTHCAVTILYFQFSQKTNEMLHI